MANMWSPLLHVFDIQGKATLKRTGDSSVSQEWLRGITSSHSWPQTKTSPFRAQTGTPQGVMPTLCCQVVSLEIFFPVLIGVVEQSLFSERGGRYSHLPRLYSCFSPMYSFFFFSPVCSDPGEGTVGGLVAYKFYPVYFAVVLGTWQLRLDQSIAGNLTFVSLTQHCVQKIESLVH